MTDQKRKSVWRKYMPVVYLVVLVVAALAIHWWINPVLSDVGNPVGQSTSTEPDAVGNSDEKSDFQKLVAQEEARLQQMLAEKRTPTATQGREAAIRHYEDRLNELEELYQKASTGNEREDTVANGFKKNIELLKSDPPFQVN